MELDPILHQPVRTRIVAYLAARGEASFSELKQALNVTDGNLDAHARKLLTADYLRVRKDGGDGRPQSIFTLTEQGRHAFKEYVSTLQSILG